jgi:hypothetical protein
MLARKLQSKNLQKSFFCVNAENFMFKSIEEFTPPTQVKLRKNKDELEITWPDKTFVFPAELLRVESPSVEVQGFLPGQKKVPIVHLPPLCSSLRLCMGKKM